MRAFRADPALAEGRRPAPAPAPSRPAAAPPPSSATSPASWRSTRRSARSWGDCGRRATTCPVASAGRSRRSGPRLTASRRSGPRPCGRPTNRAPSRGRRPALDDAGGARRRSRRTRAGSRPRRPGGEPQGAAGSHGPPAGSRPPRLARAAGGLRGDDRPPDRPAQVGAGASARGSRVFGDGPGAAPGRADPREIGFATGRGDSDYSAERDGPAGAESGSIAMPARLPDYGVA